MLFRGLIRNQNASKVVRQKYILDNPSKLSITYIILYVCIQQSSTTFLMQVIHVTSFIFCTSLRENIHGFDGVPTFYTLIHTEML